MRLSEAVLLCLWRRARRALESQPVVAAAFLLVYVAVPPGLFLASRALGPTLGPALGQPSVARGLLVGLVLPAAAAGAVVAMLGARQRPDMQLVASPLPRSALTAAVVGVPVLVLAALAAPGVVAFALPVAAAAPSGPPGTLVVLGAIGIGLLAGGAAVAAWTCVRHGGATMTRGGLALAAASLAAGAAWPLEPAADALAGRGSLAAAAATLVVLATALTASWLLLEPGPTRVPVRGPARSARLGRFCPRVTARATVALLARRGDVRASLVGLLLAFVAGAGVAEIGGAPAPVGLLLGATGAAVVLAPAALAVGGMLEDGRWLWGAAPARRGTVVAASIAGAGLLVTPWIGAAVSLAMLVKPGSGSAVIGVLGAIAGSWGCALVAGMLVPWSRAGVGEQAVALAVFATIGAAGSLAIARLGPELTAVGVPTAGVAVVLPLLPIAAAVGLGTRRIARAA